LLLFNFKFNFIFMKTVTMLEFRRNAARLLRRIANGERFVLSHRGKPAARLEPVRGPPAGDPGVDPFLTIGRRATASPKGRTKHAEIDRILYGRG
jgi:antitoxin (DNA-binding transcriptional repressor) of toxin-antitoxin stability system